MKYNQLLNIIKTPIFSLSDLKLFNLKVYPYQLSQWTKAGYLIKLKNGLYLFAERKDKIRIEQIAFLLYQPSYISLEWALSHYNLIPEMVYSCTSVTTKKTRTLRNEFGNFIYRHLKEDFFWGYKEIKDEHLIYLLAEAEKALADFIYLNKSRIDDLDDIEELRFNPFVLKDLDFEKMKEYFFFLNSRKMKLIYNLLCQYVDSYSD